MLCSTGSVLDVRVFCLSNIENRLTAPPRFGENHLRAVWRLSLGLGVVPAAAVFIWRLNMDEPPIYKKNSMKHAKIPYMLVIRRYWVRLTALAIIWCVVSVHLIDVYVCLILNLKVLV